MSRSYFFRCARVVSIAATLLSFACESDAPTQIIEAPLLPSGDAPRLPALEPPFAAEEIENRVVDFRWEDTEPLAELDEAGRPALHYALVLLTERADIDELALMELHFDALPLFEIEHARWEGQTGMHHFPGSSVGDFAFALLPAEVFNYFRERALAGEPVFDAVILQDIPEPEARMPGGSLDYEWMLANGFDYGASQLEETGTREDGVGSSGSMLLGRIVRAARRVVRAAVNGVRRAANEVREFIGGTRPFSLRLFVHNTDPYFSPRQELLRQAWGQDVGDVIYVDGLEVLVASGVMISLDSVRTDSNGFVRMDVPQAGRIRVHIRLKNAAADMVGLFWDKRITVFHGSVDDNAPIHINADVRDADMNAIAQMTDARRFSHEILDYESPRAIRSHSPVFTRHMPTALVRSGGIASALPNASAPCLGFYGFGSFSFGDGRGWSLAANIVSIFDEADIWLPEDSAVNRSTSTHEYAHFMQCAFLADHSRRAFGRAWGEVWQDSLSEDGPSDGEAGILAEAWADFLTSQIAGGVRYFTQAAATRTTAGALCDSSTDPRMRPCLEDNIGGAPGDWPRGVWDTGFVGSHSARNSEMGRFVTIFTDMFDGAPSTTRFHNGLIWDLPTEPSGSAPLPISVRIGNHAADEAVALEGPALIDFIHEWAESSNRLSYGSFLDATARVMLDRGVPVEDMCELFAIHSPSHSCADLIDTTFVSRGIPLPPPTDLSVEITHAARAARPVGELSFASTAPLANAFEIGWRVADAPTLGGVRREGHARTTTQTFAELPFDREIIFTAQVLLDARSGPIAEVTARSPAQPVDSATGEALAGAVRLQWPAVAASEYVVRMVAPEMRELGRTSEPTFVARGLAGETEYAFEIVSVNGSSELSAFASPVVRVTTLPSLDIYVSRIHGDDASPVAGSELVPFATLSAALASAGTEPTTLHLDGDTYDEPPLVLNGRDITIVGGYWRNGAQFIPMERETILRPAFAPTFLPVTSHDRFRPRSGLVRAAVAVTDGALSLRGIALQPTGAADGSCYDALWALNADITVIESMVNVEGDPTCAVGAYVRGGRASVRDSTVAGVRTGSRFATTNAVGLYTSGTADVGISDSSLFGIAWTPATAMPSGIEAVMAWTDRGSERLRVSRSTLRAMVVPRSYVLANGTSSAADIQWAGSASFDNSVMTTPSGANTAQTLRIRANGSVGNVVEFIHCTVVHGTRYSSTTRAPRGTAAAVIDWAGPLRTVRLVNNIFAFADWGTWTEGDAILDFQDVSSAVAYVGTMIRGNVFSYPPHDMFTPLRGGGPMVFCLDQGIEFDVAAFSERDVNLPEPYSCHNGGSLRVEDNVVLFRNPGGGIAADRNAVALQPDGSVDRGFAGTYELLQMSGVPLTLPLNVTSVIRDRSGTPRADAAMPGVGAWILP